MKLSPLPEKPLVSIIVPSYNQGRFIGETIESILSQSYRPLEILVIDGASTDETIDVIKSFGECHELRWWSEPDNGVVDAVNKGLARAQGEIGAIQSSDDYYIKDALSTSLSHFQLDENVGLVYGDIATVDELGNEISRTKINPFSLENFLTKETWIPQPSTFFRLELSRQIGGWDDRFFNADTQFWMRMIFKTQIIKINAVLSCRRMHQEQRNTRIKEIKESFWKMMDTSPELKNLSWKLRRAAQCGKYRHAVKYNPSGSDFMATYYLWRAILAYPKVIRTIGLSGSLIPGYFFAHRALSRIKRLIAKI